MLRRQNKSFRLLSLNATTVIPVLFAAGFFFPLLPTGAKCIHWRCTIWLFPICASILPVYGNPIAREAVCDVMVLHTATVRVEGGGGVGVGIGRYID